MRLANIFCFMQTDFNLLLMPLTNQQIIFCTIARKFLIKLSLDGYHWKKHNINRFCWNDSEFNDNQNPLAKTIGMNVYPWNHYFLFIDNIHSAHADRRYCTVKNPYIFQYLIIMKCFTYLWINFLFVKMKQVSPQLILLIPIPHIKETCGSQTLLFKHLKQPISYFVGWFCHSDKLDIQNMSSEDLPHKLQVTTM